MEQVIRIKAKSYAEQNVIFGHFAMKFDKKGIAEIKVEDENALKQLDEVVKSYSYALSYLDDATNSEMEAASQKNISTLQSRINSLMEENKALKAANEELASQNVTLQAEIKAYRDLASQKTQAEQKVEENAQVRSELEKKTMDELKQMLKELAADNTNIKEEEYRNLNKRGLVDYILSKIQ